MIVNPNSIVQHVIQIKNWIIKHANVSAKFIIYAKRIPVGILAHAFVKYLKIISDDSTVVCGEIISVMDIISTKMANNIAKNVTRNCPSKKVWYKIDFCILHIVVLAIKLLLMITIFCYHCAKHR